MVLVQCVSECVTHGLGGGSEEALLQQHGQVVEGEGVLGLAHQTRAVRGLHA